MKQRMVSAIKILTVATVAAATMAAVPALANSARYGSYQGGPKIGEGYVVGSAGHGGGGYVGPYAAAPTYGPEYGYDAYASSYGYDAYATAPGSTMTAPTPGVISYGHYAGWDPDPAIRLMLKRDATGVNAP